MFPTAWGTCTASVRLRYAIPSCLRSVLPAWQVALLWSGQETHQLLNEQCNSLIESAQTHATIDNSFWLQTILLETVSWECNVIRFVQSCLLSLLYIARSYHVSVLNNPLPTTFIALQMTHCGYDIPRSGLWVNPLLRNSYKKNIICIYYYTLILPFDMFVIFLLAKIEYYNKELSKLQWLFLSL